MDKFKFTEDLSNLLNKNISVVPMNAEYDDNDASIEVKVGKNIFTIKVIQIK